MIANMLHVGRMVLLDLLGKEHPYALSNSTHVNKAVDWLCIGQDRAGGGGVSEGYHLFHGWLPPYPETTGYIIETVFEYARINGNANCRERAIRMGNWLLSVQNEDGSIPDSYMKRKMVFDTGQVIFGFVKCYEETGFEKYKLAAERAGEWLLKVQEQSGEWIKCSVDEIPHTYYSRVAWSLLRLHKITGDQRYIEACQRNIDWCLKQQRESGWFDKASFNLRNHHRPFTHTIAYTLDGVLEAGIYLHESRFIVAAKKALDALLGHIGNKGYVSGTFAENWLGDSSFSCLTGNAQLAINMFRLFSHNGDDRYLSAGQAINNYLKKKQELRINDPNINGAIAGSYPMWGNYIHFAYPNWATKFFVDSLMMEEQLTQK